MAILGDVIKNACDCSSSAVNTGQLGCKTGFGYPVHALPVKKGTKIPVSADVDLAYINSLIQEDKLIPLMNAFSAESEQSDDTYETSPLGVEALTLRGLPKFMLTFKESEYFYKQLASLTSFGAYDVILGDINGNWLFAADSDYQNLKGFSVGQVNAMMAGFATATEARKKTISFQLTNRNEIDRNYSMVLASSLFPITDVQGVNSVTLSSEDANGAVIPAAGDTTLKIKAVFTNDCDESVDGVDSLGVEVNGATVSSTIAEDGNGYYTVTIPALTAGDSVSVFLYDSTVDSKVIVLSDVLFRASDLTLNVA